MEPVFTGARAIYGKKGVRLCASMLTFRTKVDCNIWTPGRVVWMEPFDLTLR